MSLLRSGTPVEPMCPCLGGHIGAAPTSGTVKASDDEHFGAHSRSFGTCSPTLRVSCCHSRARLASGWLAGLYREGVEPSGSLRKVSDHMVIPLSCPPDARYLPSGADADDGRVGPTAVMGGFHFRFASGLAISWACWMKSFATGLSVRFFRVTIANSTRAMAAQQAGPSAPGAWCEFKCGVRNCQKTPGR